MISEFEFIQRFREEKNIYLAWGHFVQQRIVNNMQDHIVRKKQIFAFEPSLRLKDENSLVEKAFYRRKMYNDPYLDIKDKVGIRFVVLVPRFTKLVSDSIECIREWDAAVDRDWQDESQNHPYIFDYQSIHYIISSRNDRDVSLHIENREEKVAVPKGTPCEVQIRTVLQHSFAELAHDAIYKPVQSIDPEDQRKMSRSLALTEAADIFYDEVMSVLEDSTKWYDEWIAHIAKLSENLVDPDHFNKRYCYRLLSALRPIIPSSYTELEDYIATKPKILDAIRNKSQTGFIYSQPTIILLCFLVKNNKYQLRELYPFAEEELRPIFIGTGTKFCSE